MIIIRKRIYTHTGLLFFICTLFFSRGTPCALAQPLEESSYTRSFTTDPLVVDIHISRKEMTIAESLTVTVSAHAPEKYDIILPEFQAALGDFTIMERSDAKKELTDTGLLISKTWEVEPFLPGEYSIPVLSITATDRSNPEKTFLTTTSEIVIPVTSFLDSTEEEPALADIIPPVALARDTTWIYIAAGLLIFITAAGLFWLFRKRSSSKKDIPAIPCHIEAFTAINALAGENLPAKGRHKEFFNRLSLILRHYIESRFTIKAPEQTTEEFFADLRASDLFNQDQKDRLRHFLSRSDLIKFAEAQPTEGETSQSLDLCRDFIEQTSEHDTKGNGGTP